MHKVTDILINAGLLNEVQVQVAQHDQTLNPDMRLSEILSLRGWIAEETVDFFDLLWEMRVKQGDRQMIGEYFLEARLLTPAQVEDVVTEQKISNLRFGEVAVLKGYLKPETVRFFVKHLFPHNFTVKNVSPFSRTTQTQVHKRTMANDMTLQQTEESVEATKQEYSQQRPKPFPPKPFPPKKAPPRQPAQRSFLNRIKTQMQHKLAEVNHSHGEHPKRQAPQSSQAKPKRDLPENSFSTSYDLMSVMNDDDDCGLDDL